MCRHPYRYALALGLTWLPWLPLQAHLLNMTTVQVNLEAGGRLQVDLKIDVTRAAGGSLDYYRMSQVASPLEAPPTRALLDRLQAAVVVALDGTPVALHTTAAEFPRVAREVFLDPLSWPMTHVLLQGRLPAATGQASPGGRAPQLTATFAAGFPFEEPIALTFELPTEHRRMTRWLVTSQVSPAFELADDTTRRPDDTLADRAPATAAVPAPALSQFLRFGFLHILPRGWDHVLFVLGLYFGARSLKSLLLLVTCFTLAHSITLGLAAIGVIRLSPSVVEPLISASIAWIAVENFFAGARSERFRPLLVFAFGLLHGLGFASALSALATPSSSFLPALLAFNIGIELGQLTVIGGALALTAAYRNRPWYRQRLALPASALMAAVAVLWTLQRLV